MMAEKKGIIFECLVFQLKCFLSRCDKSKRFKHMLHTMCGITIKELLQPGAERKVRVLEMCMHHVAFNFLGYEVLLYPLCLLYLMINK